MKSRILSFCLVVIGILLFASCDEGGGKVGKNGKKETATSGEIWLAIDENFRPIFDSEIVTFQHRFPDAIIHPLYMPGEDAIEFMLKYPDSVAGAITTRPLTKAENERMAAKQRAVRSTFFASDAIALIMHPSNPDSVLDRKEMIDILSGKATSWKDINKDSPLKDIILAFDNANSSTAKFIKDSLLNGGELSKKAFAAKTNEEVLQYVAKTPNAVGIVGVNWISDHDDPKAIGFLKGIQVAYLETPVQCKIYGEDTGRYFQPHQAIIAGKCYPLVRKIYAMDCETDFLLGMGFFTYLDHEGQRVILKSGLVPAYGVKRVVKFPESK